MQIPLLTAATATNGAPSGATAGVKMPFTTDRSLVFVKSTAGSGTMTVTLKMWGYNIAQAFWYPLGVDATPANKGLLNGGNAIAEGPTADVISHCEEITSLRKIDRVYLEVVAIGGTSTAVTAVLDCCQASNVTES